MLLFFGVQLNPASAQAKDIPGAGDAHIGYQTLTAAGISPGALLPMQIVVEGPAAAGDLSSVVRRLEATPGIVGAAVPTQSRKGNFAVVEAFADADAAAKSTRDDDHATEGRDRPGAPNRAGRGHQGDAVGRRPPGP